MNADSSDRDRHHHEHRHHDDRAPHEPAADLSWMYRSEAFAEDLDDAPRLAAVADPARRSPLARPVRAVLRSLGGRLSPGLAG